MVQVELNERPRLLTEAETEKREAETQAEIIKDKADSDARILNNRCCRILSSKTNMFVNNIVKLVKSTIFQSIKKLDLFCTYKLNNCFNLEPKRKQKPS